MGKKRLGTGAAPPPRALSPRNRFLLAVTGIAFLVVAGTAEEKTFGTVSDEQQMLDTAVSIATFGEIGISRGQIFSVPRPAGDAVSPYAMGQSLVETPAALAARPFEAAFGEHSSQTLFVFLQVLLVTFAAALSGLTARALGAGRFGEGLAVLGTAVASPLWAYASYGFSEPLQALALAGAAASSLHAAARHEAGDARAARWLAAAAGLAAAVAVLGKAVNLLVGPLLLLPLVVDREGRPAPARRLGLVGAAAAGAAGPLAAWLAFEVVRFGRPLSSYAGYGFNHFIPDGLWRLLVGPNKGLLLFFPLLVLSAAGLTGLIRRPATRGGGVSLALASVATLLLFSAWWSWDGMSGWGPRLLVPILPLLAAAAGAAAVTPGRRRLGLALAGLGVGVNLLGVLQSEAAAFHYVVSAGGVAVSPEEMATYPEAFRAATKVTGPVIVRPLVARYDPAYAQIRLHAFLLWNRLKADDRDDLARRLESPPWIGKDPAAVPSLPFRTGSVTTTSPLVNYLTMPFSWPHLGAAIPRRDGEPPGTWATPFRNALLGQVFRNLDLGRPERAAPLAAFLHEQLPSGFTGAVSAECLRVAGRGDEARAFLRALPAGAQASPSVKIVEALLARDEGREDEARARLAEAGRRLRTPALERALGSPPSEWPRSFRLFLTDTPDAGTETERGRAR